MEDGTATMDGLVFCADDAISINNDGEPSLDSGDCVIGVLHNGAEVDEDDEAACISKAADCPVKHTSHQVYLIQL